MSQTEIEKLFVEKFNKFTKPQQRIITRLLSGDRLTIVNKNRMSSEYKWAVPNSPYLEDAGHVYKAFWGIEYTLYKLTKNRVTIGQFFFV